MRVDVPLFYLVKMTFFLGRIRWGFVVVQIEFRKRIWLPIAVQQISLQSGTGLVTMEIYRKDLRK